MLLTSTTCSSDVDCTGRNVGRVTLRRLNRVEYNNTIRDLVGVDFKPAADFPNDDVGYGFDNIGDVLSLSPLLLEKYLSAAETILEQAIVIADPPKPAEAIQLPASASTRRRRRTRRGCSARSCRQGEVSGEDYHEEGDYTHPRARCSASSSATNPVRGDVQRRRRRPRNSS